MEKEFDFYDLDMHKNVLDYFKYLRLHPEAVGHQRFQAKYFLYIIPLLIAIIRALLQAALTPSL